MMMKVRLYAEDLWSKWGFGDGDILGGHERLITEVRMNLLPAVKDKFSIEIPVYEICCCHNPIRVDDDFPMPEELENFYIEVEYESGLEGDDWFPDFTHKGTTHD